MKPHGKRQREGCIFYEASFRARNGYAARILPFRRDLSQAFLLMDSLGS